MLSGFKYYRDDQESFMSLPLDHIALARCGEAMYTYWDSNNSSTRIRKCNCILDTISSLIISKEKDIINRIRSSDYEVDWEADGKDGELIVRNMVRFMTSWATERISGLFWVVRSCKTGTILIKTRETEEYDYLGEVYLVRGQKTAIIDAFPGRYFCCYATILPMYHFLVHDGRIASSSMTTCDNFRAMLDEHVKDAINLGTIVSMCESASR